jgi:hypothetical protein
MLDDGTLLCTDDNDSSVRWCTTDGEVLLTIGTPGVSAPWHSGRPFALCTDAVRAADGTFFVTDGYRNARVHHFDHRGELIRSWGAPGTGPGEFNVPHNIALDADGRLYVADRESHRIQVFDQQGTFLVSETGTAVDTATVRITAADTGTGTDTAQSANLVQATDTAAAIDSASIRQPGTDTGTGTDTAAVLTVRFDQLDAGTATDVARITPNGNADTGTTAEAVRIAQASSDSGTAVDSAFVLQSVAGADVGTAVDSAYVTVNVVDTGSADDTARIVGQLPEGRVYMVPAESRVYRVAQSRRELVV